MTEGEKLIWAAAYAADWQGQYQRMNVMGVPMSIATAVENAFAAVTDARNAVFDVREGWGDGDELAMLNEMIS